MLLSHYIPELYHLCGYRMFILCYEGGGHVGFSWVRLLASYSEYAPLFRLLCSQVMAPGWPPQPLYSRNMDKACGAVSNSCWLIKHTKETKLPLVCFLTHLFGLLVVYPNPKRWIKDFVQQRRPSLNLFGNCHVLKMNLYVKRFNMCQDHRKFQIGVIGEKHMVYFIFRAYSQ